MHLSRYNLFFNISEKEGALFNTFHGTLVLMPVADYKKLNNCEFSADYVREIFKSHAQLVLNNFCCNGREDRKELRKKLLFNKKQRDRLTVTIMTTLACNMSCVYCYQQGLVERFLHMKQNVATSIKEWTINKIIIDKPKEVIFHFYGGEPLINLDILDGIMDDIICAAEGVGAHFTSYITTNGTLLNKSNISRLKKWKLDNAQISLDGPREVHDERRPYLSGEGTYDKILSNVDEALKEGIHVVVRINVDKHNIAFVEDLFKEMRDRGLNKYMALQINIEIVSPIMNPSEHCNRYTFASEDEMKALAGLWSMQVKYGFPIKSAMPIDSACENQIENSYTFSSNGDIYMCPGFIGIKDFIIGNIESNIFDEKKYNSFIDMDIWENCLDCEYGPVCQGGCKMCGYVTNKEFGKTYCRKDFISSIYPEFIKSKYNLEGKDGQRFQG